MSTTYNEPYTYINDKKDHMMTPVYRTPATKRSGLEELFCLCVVNMLTYKLRQPALCFINITYVFG